MDQKGQTMKNAIRMFVLAATAAALTASSAFAQATIHGDLLKDWANQKDMLVKIANAMPEDKFGFKPTPAQRSFGEQVLHIRRSTTCWPPRSAERRRRRWST
jgi:hypothetical protein